MGLMARWQGVVSTDREYARVDAVDIFH